MYLNSIPYSEVEAMQVDTQRFMQVVQAEDVILPEEEEMEDEDLTKRPAEGGGGGGSKTEQGVESRGILALITRHGASNGAVADLLSDSGLGGNLQDALSSIGGVRVGRAGDEGIGSGTRGSGTGGPGTGSGVGIGNIGALGTRGTADTGAKKTQAVKSKMATAAGGVTGKIDAAKVRSTIRSQLGGVRHCYEMQLKVNPSLAGRIAIQFTIGSSGGVSSCSVTGDSMGNNLVSSCVCRRVQRWRFPPPDEGSVTVSYSFVFTPAE
jgi:TonB family protein